MSGQHAGLPWQIFKSALANGLYIGGALAAMRLARRAAHMPRVHVLGFHRIVPDFQAAADRCLPALCTSTASFETLLDYAVYHMDVLDLESAVAALIRRRPLRRDACVLTFDDGYRDFYTRAFPILRRRGLPASVFIVSDHTGSRKLLPHDRLYAVMKVLAGRHELHNDFDVRRWIRLARQTGPARAVEVAARSLARAPMEALIEQLEATFGPGDPPDEDGYPLTWEMCGELLRGGIEVGTHTASHTPLGLESREAILDELSRSVDEIEQRLGRRPRFAAYPNGVYNKDVISAAQKLGLAAALTTEDRPNWPGRTHRLLMSRKLVWEAHARGIDGYPSRAMCASQLENIYAVFGRGLVHGDAAARRARERR
jgi:peptidoglycan/xylan/chitin deacetylase (PgdA/CDA1 family)